MMYLRMLVAVMLGAVMAAFVGVPPSRVISAVAEPDVAPMAAIFMDGSPSPEATEELRWQSDVGDYVDSLIGAATKSGVFTAGAFENDSHGFTLYGVGDQPPRAVAALLANPPSQVTPLWRSVPFSEEELFSAVDKLSTSAEGLTVVAVDDDFSGMTVQRTSDAVKVPPTVNGVPVTSIQTGGTTPVGLTNARGTEGGPFRGGQRTNVELPSGHWGNCSTGFRVYQGTDRSMLTAAHCTWQGDPATITPGREFRLYGNDTVVGHSTSAGQASRDVQLIDDQGYLNAIYTGCSSCDTYRNIAGGAGYLDFGEWVCISGGYSGASCGIVNTTYADINIGTGYGTRLVLGLALIQASPETYAIAGDGDSGSPAFTNPSGDTSADVYAAGIVSGSGGHLETCPAFATLSGHVRNCWSAIWIEPWSRFRDKFSPELTLFP